MDAIKSEFPTIKHVGVWLTLQGYWNGIHPQSWLGKRYELRKFGVRPYHTQYPYPPAVKDIFLPAISELERFWDDYFSALSCAGVEFVKIDNQASIDYLVGDGAAEMRLNIGKYARAAAIKQFGNGNLINCMAHSSRNSSDFLIERPAEHSSYRCVFPTLHEGPDL